MNVLQVNGAGSARRRAGIGEKDKDFLKKFLEKQPKDSYGMRFLMRSVS